MQAPHQRQCIDLQGWSLFSFVLDGMLSHCIFLRRRCYPQDQYILQNCTQDNLVNSRSKPFFANC